MKNAKQQLKRAIKKTTKFILNLEEHSSERVPEWFEQMALSSSHNGLNNSMYESLLAKLKAYLHEDFGSTATKALLS